MILWCDGLACPESITFESRDLVETRRLARTAGWAVLSGTMDVCSFHNQRGPNTKRPAETGAAP